jgi:hypothetical protein
MAYSMNEDDRARTIKHQIFRWLERGEIARKQKQNELLAATTKIVAIYEGLLDSAEDPGESTLLRKANGLRKRIESAEQHRTMCAEHGLSDAAIDATYEIQSMEKELVDLISNDQGL